MNQKANIRISKKDIINRVASKANCETKEASRFTDAVINVLRDLFVNADPGTKIILRELGHFLIYQTNPRKSAHNPKAPHIKIQVPARRRVVFKPSKVIKDALHEPMSSEGAAREQKVIL
ncbi:MAG: HU family DNA-binding protein [bacterium]|nr:HU family DNA-binding protein [bacterium]